MSLVYIKPGQINNKNFNIVFPLQHTFSISLKGFMCVIDFLVFIDIHKHVVKMYTNSIQNLKIFFQNILNMFKRVFNELCN